MPLSLPERSALLRGGDVLVSQEDGPCFAGAHPKQPTEHSFIVLSDDVPGGRSFMEILEDGSPEEIGFYLRIHQEIAEHANASPDRDRILVVMNMAAFQLEGGLKQTSERKGVTSYNVAPNTIGAKMPTFHAHDVIGRPKEGFEHLDARGFMPDAKPGFLEAFKTAHLGSDPDSWKTVDLSGTELAEAPIHKVIVAPRGISNIVELGSQSKNSEICLAFKDALINAVGNDYPQGARLVFDHQPGLDFLPVHVIGSPEEIGEWHKAPPHGPRP